MGTDYWLHILLLISIYSYSSNESPSYYLFYLNKTKISGLSPCHDDICVIKIQCHNAIMTCKQTPSENNLVMHCINHYVQHSHIFMVCLQINNIQFCHIQISNRSGNDDFLSISSTQIINFIDLKSFSFFSQKDNYPAISSEGLIFLTLITIISILTLPQYNGLHFTVIALKSTTKRTLICTANQSWVLCNLQRHAIWWSRIIYAYLMPGITYKMIFLMHTDNTDSTQPW